MRVLVLGSSGMLGHRVTRAAAARAQTWGTIRSARPSRQLQEAVGEATLITGVDIASGSDAGSAIDAARPDVVVNCLGAVKQIIDTADPLPAIRVNTVFPLELAWRCDRSGILLVHVSTDCVFSGERGLYTEADVPDPREVYGQTKLLGEPAGDGCLVVRTSMVGREIATSHGLLEWLLTRRGGAAQAWTRALFSGLTTPVLAELLVSLALDGPQLSGLWHVAGPPISKADVLVLMRDAFGLDVELNLDDSVAIDRTLDSSRFEAATSWRPPEWPAMIAELATDPLPYDLWRAGR